MGSAPPTAKKMKVSGGQVKACLQALTSGTAMDDCVELVLAAMQEVMEGEASPTLFAAFVTALKMRGETPAIVAACAQAMCEKALPCAVEDVVDLVGTGGDSHDTFNVSTAASLVVASTGRLRVAKHGNRASSSKCGSADILESGMGAKIDIGPEKVKEVIDKCGFCFLFAQRFHPAMRHVAAVRRELGIRTVFNILGPLANPARPRAILGGVYAHPLGRLLAETYRCQGMPRAMVVHGMEGLDEISPAGETQVWELANGEIKEYMISPDTFGLPKHPLSDVKGDDATYNANILRSLVGLPLASGAATPPDSHVAAVRDYVLMNGAALCYVGGAADDLPGGVALCRAALEEGKTRQLVEEYVALTNM